MLNSKAEEPYWTQIAGVLGVVGDERAINALIAFVEKPVSEAHLSRAHQDARQQAIMSLGYLINKTGSERALTYLIDGLTPSEWRQRRVQGIAPWASSYEEYDLQLSKYALFGLALSGHPRAGEALRSLQQSPTAEQMQFRKGLDSTLTQWLEVHAQVAAQGVAGMYEHYENERRHQREAQLEEIERLRGPEARRLHEAQESPSEPQ
jgi:HEAT repeat protein